MLFVYQPIARESINVRNHMHIWFGHYSHSIRIWLLFLNQYLIAIICFLDGSSLENHI